MPSYQGVSGPTGTLCLLTACHTVLCLTPSPPPTKQVLASSLVFFQGPQRTMQLVRQISISLGEEARPRNLRQRLENVATIIILYIPVRRLERPGLPRLFKSQ